MKTKDRGHSPQNKPKVKYQDYIVDVRKPSGKPEARVDELRIVYKCGFKDCRKHYYCEVGCFARLDCKHLDSNDNMINWYPVEIVRTEDG